MVEAMSRLYSAVVVTGKYPPLLLCMSGSRSVHHHRLAYNVSTRKLRQFYRGNVIYLLNLTCGTRIRGGMIEICKIISVKYDASTAPQIIRNSFCSYYR